MDYMYMRVEEARAFETGLYGFVLATWLPRYSILGQFFVKISGFGMTARRLTLL